MTERQCLRTELRENFYRPLWGGKKQSSSSLDGVVRCFPSEAPVGPLTRPSGLSRAQQLIILDTLKILFLPSFCSLHGGLAFDRAFPLLGTSHWWSALLLRVKAQQCLQNGGPRFADKLRNVGAGENYCLSLKSKARLGRFLTASFVFRRYSFNFVSIVVRVLLYPYGLLSVQLTTSVNSDLLLYVLELCLAGRKTSLEASIETDNASTVRNIFRRQNPDEESLGRWDGIGGRVDFTHKFDLYKLLVSCAFREKFQTHGSALFLPAVLSTEIVSNDLHYPFHYRLGLHQVLDVFPNTQDVSHEFSNAVYFQGGFGIDGVVTLIKSPRIMKPKEEPLERARGSNLNPGFRKFLPLSNFRRSRTSKPYKSNREDSSEVFPQSESVLKSLREQIMSLKKASQQISSAKKFIDEGKLKTLSSLNSLAFEKKQGNKIFLPTPHLKVGGLAGVVSSFGFHKDGLERMSLPEGGFVSPALLRRRASLRWKSTLDETPVKAFVGCSISAQLGRMKRKLFSFTSAIAQFECSVPIPIVQTSLPRRIQHISASQRNLMIGNIPLRPLVNFSFTQQVVGPVRFKADYRVALESSSNVGSASNLVQSNAVVRQIQTIRPCVVDAQFGMDFVVPGTHGAVKFGGWYTPSRKEAMAELRIF